jgi:hypothetical protein
VHEMLTVSSVERTLLSVRQRASGSAVDVRRLLLVELGLLALPRLRLSEVLFGGCVRYDSLCAGRFANV